MGCDFGWKGRQPDIAKQEECLDFIFSLAKRFGWEHDLFFHKRVEGLFRFEGRKDIWVNEVDLLGITIYPLGKEGMKDFSSPLAGQISFVFNNSSSLPEEKRHSIVSFKWAEDLSESHLKALKRELPEGEKDNLLGAFEMGGYWRALGDAWGLATILLFVKEKFVPSLEASDDYGYFEGAQEQAASCGLLDLIRGKKGKEGERWAYSILLKVIEEHIGWKVLKEDFERMDELFEEMTKYIDSLEGVELPPLEKFRGLFRLPPEADLDRILIEALHLSGAEASYLRENGINTVGGLLRKSDEELTSLFLYRSQDRLRELKEKLHFFLYRLSKLPPEEIGKLLSPKTGKPFGRG